MNEIDRLVIYFSLWGLIMMQLYQIDQAPKQTEPDYKRLYLECNGTISRANKDSLMYLKIEK